MLACVHAYPVQYAITRAHRTALRKQRNPFSACACSWRAQRELYDATSSTLPTALALLPQASQIIIVWLCQKTCVHTVADRPAVRPSRRRGRKCSSSKQRQQPPSAPQTHRARLRWKTMFTFGAWKRIAPEVRSSRLQCVRCNYNIHRTCSGGVYLCSRHAVDVAAVDNDIRHYFWHITQHPARQYLKIKTFALILLLHKRETRTRAAPVFAAVDFMCVSAGAGSNIWRVKTCL